ncbi:hypothetical protein Hte_011449 [Hypoxylon texense]
MRTSNLKVGRTFQDLYQHALLPWGWELLSWFSALGLLIAIFTITYQAEGKPQQDWSFPITLNSLIATLSTIYRAVLVAIAAQIISQDKWIWFWKPSSPVQPLRDLQLFEDASRGLWGAITLVPVVARHSLSSLVAIFIIVVSIATGPFIQQSIRVNFSESVLGSGTASLPVSFSVKDPNSYFRTLSSPSFGMWDLGATPRGALFSTLTNPLGNDSTIVPSCVTGNCTFPTLQPTQREDGVATHASIGVCSSCTNVSSLVTVTPQTYHRDSTNGTHPTYSLPNGMELILFDSAPHMILNTQDTNLSWAAKVIPPETLAFSRWALANVTVFTMAARNQSEDEDLASPTGYAAVTCSLYPCLQYYNAFVQNGRLSETLVHSTPLYPDINQFTTDPETLFYDGTITLPQSNVSLAAVLSPCNPATLRVTSNTSDLANETVRIISPDGAPDYPSMVTRKGCVYRFHSFMFYLMGSVIQKDLNGTCGWDARQGNSIECGDTWWLAPFWEQKHASVGTIVDRISTIATAMTNQFRLGLSREAGSRSEVLGSALQTFSYIAIEWQWLILPTILLALETLVLFQMIARSWRYREEEMAWKSNILPLLYYKDRFTGVDGQPLGGSIQQTDITPMGGPFRTAAQMEEISSHIQVKLQRGNRHVEDETGEVIEIKGLKRRGRSARDWDQDSLIIRSEEDI